MGVGVSVGTGVKVGVGVSVDVGVGVSLGDGVSVGVGVSEGVGVGVSVGTGVKVSVGVTVGVGVEVTVGIGVCVGVGEAKGFSKGRKGLRIGKDLNPGIDGKGINLNKLGRFGIPGKLKLKASTDFTWEKKVIDPNTIPKQKYFKLNLTFIFIFIKKPLMIAVI